MNIKYFQKFIGVFLLSTALIQCSGDGVAGLSQDVSVATVPERPVVVPGPMTYWIYLEKQTVAASSLKANVRYDNQTAKYLILMYAEAKVTAASGNSGVGTLNYTFSPVAIDSRPDTEFLAVISPGESATVSYYFGNLPDTSSPTFPVDFRTVGWFVDSPTDKYNLIERYESHHFFTTQ